MPPNREEDLLLDPWNARRFRPAQAGQGSVRGDMQTVVRPLLAVSAALHVDPRTRVPVVVGDPLGSLHLGRTGLSDDQVRHVQHLAAVPVGLALGAAS